MGEGCSAVAPLAIVAFSLPRIYYASLANPWQGQLPERPTRGTEYDLRRQDVRKLIRVTEKGWNARNDKNPSGPDRTGQANRLKYFSLPTYKNLNTFFMEIIQPSETHKTIVNTGH